jgi:hypothetical protein
MRDKPKACKRSLANPARFALNLPSAEGVNNAETDGEPSSKAVLTSGPTSNA